ITAVIDPADARRSASVMMRSSITLSFVGLLVDWMTNASTPRTFSPISTKLSPSLKRVTLHLPSGVSRYCPMAAASSGFALPEKRHTFLNTREPPRENRHEGAGHHLPAALRSVNGRASLRRRSREKSRVAGAASTAAVDPVRGGRLDGSGHWDRGRKRRVRGGHRHLRGGVRPGVVATDGNRRFDERRETQGDRDADHPDHVSRKPRAAAGDARRHFSQELRVAELELVS